MLLAIIAARDSTGVSVDKTAVDFGFASRTLRRYVKISQTPRESRADPQNYFKYQHKSEPMARIDGLRTLGLGPRQEEPEHLPEPKQHLPEPKQQNVPVFKTEQGTREKEGPQLLEPQLMEKYNMAVTTKP